jgi:hypothetical protein
MKFINTSNIFSNIKARDAIYIDNLIQTNTKGKLTLKGTVNSFYLVNNPKNLLTKFEITFYQIRMFSCTSLDFSLLDKDMVSNFNIISDSIFILDNKLSDYNHFVLSTYDYVYEIVAKDYEITY